MTKLYAVCVVALALQAAPAPAAGRFAEETYDSKVYGGPRHIWTYMPAAPPAGLLVCLWGADYVERIPVRSILDDLIGKGRIPPLAAILSTSTATGPANSATDSSA